MKQIFKELMVENSNLACLIGKLLFLFIVLFISYILEDFPYVIVFTFALTSFEMSVMKMHGHINYILPVTSHEKKMNTIIKSIITAGIYSFVNTISYVWLVYRTEEAWKFDVILFLVYMTLVVFLYFFTYRTGLSIVGCSIKELENENKAGAFEITVNAFGYVLSVISCPVYIIYKFGKVGYPSFLMKNIGFIEICLGGFSLIFLLYSAIKNIKRISYLEYYN